MAAVMAPRHLQAHMQALGVMTTLLVVPAWLHEGAAAPPSTGSQAGFTASVWHAPPPPPTAAAAAAAEAAPAPTPAAAVSLLPALKPALAVPVATAALSTAAAAGAAAAAPADLAATVLPALAAATTAPNATAAAAAAAARAANASSAAVAHATVTRNATAPAPACSFQPGVADGMLQHNGRDIFLTGVNLGNVQFLPFEGNPYGLSAAELRSMLDRAFADIAATGANSVRFWLHIDGSRTPSWGIDQATGQAMVSGLPPGFLEDLKWLLSTAYQQHGLLLSISLWSHDILAVRRNNPESHRARAILMMSDDRAANAYVDNALVPMLQALQGEMVPGGPRFVDAVLAFEVLNEPEGMSSYWRLYKNYQYNMSWGNYTWGSKSFPCLSRPNRSRNATLLMDSKGGLTAKYTGWFFTVDDGEFNDFMYHDVIDNYPSEWDFLAPHIMTLKTLTTQEVLHTKLLRFVNRVAGAIKRAAPGTKLTVGTHSMPYNSDVAIPNLKLGRSDYETAPFNYYKDNMLVAAGGDAQGTLDFYSVHGYPVWGEPKRDIDISMFLNPKSHWCLNKPVVVGEHWDEVLSEGQHVNASNYVHLHQTGYAGAWGWAWFNVTENFDPVSGVGVRGLGQHSCQGSLRQLLSSLPAALRYPAHTSNQTTGNSTGSSGVSTAGGSSNPTLPAVAAAGGASNVEGRTLPVTTG